MTLNEPFEGKISEVLFYNGKINDDEIININSYLSKKWNLTSTIDSDGDGIVDASDPFPTDPSKWINFPQALRDNASDNFTAMNGLALWLDASNIDGGMNSSLSDGDAVGKWKDLSGNTNHASIKGTNSPTLSGNKIVLDGSNYFYVENDDELILKNSNTKKYHIFIVYKSTGDIDPDQGSTMLFGNYETNSTIGTYRSGGYPNMYYGLQIFEENNTYANNPGNGFLRFSGRDDDCLLYTSPSPRDKRQSRMPSSA